ncbi:phospho-N-acetylmuramoyl-pentapeptide-transferase [Brockia lithotrophica]|uniref:Phospho-N-acetylmuramoyl-pentapeptide-transferase n=2 Tax=Brockia lithotrophica TaxID=933949 RepID=A0A660L5K1_9BACL|nr:phospho-N-acetylmuramoyl-pentapeptide-transferase [Brockia lithotrophica]RKQ88484.1 phospho-N-acetylmuramoyl-pentapeptide-transferase [Brockia lithotrophica]
MVERVLLFAMATSFLATLLIGPAAIPLLRWLKAGQSIREEGPRWHAKKSGTPTMGGLIFLGGALFALAFFGHWTPETAFLLVATLGYAAIGFADDFLKVVYRRNLGLTARDKFLAQLALAFALFLLLAATGRLDPRVFVPFVGDVALGPGPIAYVLYFAFLLLVFVATTNAVNITDGLDGLLAGSAAIAFGAYAILALGRGHFEEALFAAALVGALVGFLFFNAHPARVFMGDTGSLALGGALAGLAVLTRTELLLVLLGGLFVVETLSVILQVIYFKRTGGKRLLRMSPLHHHFELVGWSEWRIVATFWAFEALCAACALTVEVLAR